MMQVPPSSAHVVFGLYLVAALLIAHAVGSLLCIALIELVGWRRGHRRAVRAAPTRMTRLSSIPPDTLTLIDDFCSGSPKETL